MTIDFFGAVGAEHAGANHDRIECNAAVIDGLIPRAANIATEDVAGQCGVLHFDGLVGWGQLVEQSNASLVCRLALGFALASSGADAEKIIRLA